MNIEEVRTYCLAKPFATEDMPFGPDYVTFRVGNKIFCGLPLTFGSVVQLKWNPDEFDETLEMYSFVHQGWHWHKKHMIQLDLSDSSIPGEVVKALIDRAYEYVYNRLPRKVKASLI